MVTTPRQKVSFAEYFSYDDATDMLYELVSGELIKMPPASFLHSDIIDFIAELLREVAREQKLDIKVKTGDVGIRTGIDSAQIPDLAVIDGKTWKSYRREKSAVIESGLILAVEVVSPGSEQIARDYVDKVTEYQNAGVAEYWIVDPIEQKVTVLVLDNGNYQKTVFDRNKTIVSAAFPSVKTTTNEILTF